MRKIELPIFGKIELENTDYWEYKYEASLWAYAFGELSIDIDVHFKELNAVNIDKVSWALNDIKKINEMGRVAYSTDFHNDGSTSAYIEEWEQEIFCQIFSDDEFQEFLIPSDKNASIKERLLSLLRLVRIGIYAEADNGFAVMDYAFGYSMDKGFRDNMLVVKLNEQYEVLEITSEG